MNGSKIKSFELVLENCEVYTFDADKVDVRLNKIGKHFWGKDVLQTAEEALIIIQKDCSYTGGWEDEKWFNRIHQDITQVWFKYEDGTEEGYHLDWCDDVKYENIYETDFDDGDRMIYIVSKTKKSQDDF